MRIIRLVKELEKLKNKNNSNERNQGIQDVINHLNDKLKYKKNIIIRNETQILEVYAKLYLIMQISEYQFFYIKDLVDMDISRQLNICIKNISKFIDNVEKNLNAKEQSIENAEYDSEIFSMLIDSFITAEENDKFYEFINEFNKIRAKLKVDKNRYE